MKFKIDENLPAEIAIELRSTGHDAETVTEEGMTGGADSAVMARVKGERRAFLTMDKGIADLRRYPPGEYDGIVLLRSKTTGREAVLAFVRQHLQVITSPDLQGHLVVITDRGVRVR